MQKCIGCQFYDRDHKHNEEKGGVSWGKCRRTGPIVHPVSAKAYMVEGIWPHVRDDDWCGEWAAGNRRIDSAAAVAMNSLMQSTAASPRSAVVTPVFAAQEHTVENAVSPIPTLMRGQLGSD